MQHDLSSYPIERLERNEAIPGEYWNEICVWLGPDSAAGADQLGLTTATKDKFVRDAGALAHDFAIAVELDSSIIDCDDKWMGDGAWLPFCNVDAECNEGTGEIDDLNLPPPGV